MGNLTSYQIVLIDVSAWRGVAAGLTKINQAVFQSLHIIFLCNSQKTWIKSVKMCYYTKIVIICMPILMCRKVCKSSYYAKEEWHKVILLLSNLVEEDCCWMCSSTSCCPSWPSEYDWCHISCSKLLRVAGWLYLCWIWL